MKQLYYHGTFVASFLFRNNAYLFSDGRLVQNSFNFTNTIISDSYSKIHIVNKDCAYLTYGRLLSQLDNDIKVNFLNSKSFEFKINFFADRLKYHWSKANQNNVKTGLILVLRNDHGSFSHCSLDSNNNFISKRIESLQDSMDIKLASVCTNEEKYKSSKLLKESLSFNLNSSQPVESAIINSFNFVKLLIQKDCDSVGGNIFYEKI